jgi:hypothetical protein
MNARAARRTVLLFVGTAAAVLGLAAPASATSVSGVSMSFCIPAGPLACSSNHSSIQAGTKAGYEIHFTASHGVGAGQAITITGPVGTVFPSSGNAYSVGGCVNQDPTSVTDSGRTVEVAMPSTCAVGNGGATSVSIGFFNDNGVVSPTTVGNTYRVSVKTDNDTTAANSNTYSITPGPPATITTTAGGGASTDVGTAFTTNLAVRLDDAFGNHISGENITFSAPATGPSGTFAGGANGGRDLVAATNASGVATASALTANGTPGSWEVAVSGPNSTSQTISLANDTGPAATAALVLTPSSISVNGGTSTATATITDSFGNPVIGDQVSFQSDGTQMIDATTDNGDGTYSALIHSSSTPGTSMISAFDDDVIGVGDSAPLQQNPDVPPTAVNDAATVLEDSGTTTVDVLANDTNPDGGPKTVASVTDPPHGTAVRTSSTGVTYRPDPDFCGSDSFGYTLNGGSTATVSMTVTCVDDPDVIPPETTITKAPKAKVKTKHATTSVQLSFESNEPASTFRCSVDHAAATPCSSPFTAKLKPGKHDIEVVAVDQAGNADQTPATADVKVVKKKKRH